MLETQPELPLAELLGALEYVARSYKAAAKRGSADKVEAQLRRVLAWATGLELVTAARAAVKEGQAWPNPTYLVRSIQESRRRAKVAKAASVPRETAIAIADPEPVASPPAIEEPAPPGLDLAPDCKQCGTNAAPRELPRRNREGSAASGERLTRWLCDHEYAAALKTLGSEDLAVLAAKEDPGAVAEVRRRRWAKGPG